MCKKLNVSIFEIFKGTPLIYIKNTEEIDGMYNQLTDSNKKLIRDILEVILKNQSTTFSEVESNKIRHKIDTNNGRIRDEQSKRAYLAADDYFKEKEEKEDNEDDEYNEDSEDNENYW